MIFWFSALSTFSAVKPPLSVATLASVAVNALGCFFDDGDARLVEHSRPRLWDLAFPIRADPRESAVKVLLLLFPLSAMSRADGDIARSRRFPHTPGTLSSPFIPTHRHPHEASLSRRGKQGSSGMRSHCSVAASPLFPEASCSDKRLLKFLWRHPAGSGQATDFLHAEIRRSHEQGVSGLQ